MRVYQVSLPTLLEFGKTLAGQIQPGDIVGLEGGLGAGKTTLIKSICAAWGIDPQDVTSPTYVYHHQYVGEVVVDHMDLYRIVDEPSLYHMGLSDCLNTSSIVLIEWINRFPSFANPTLTIKLVLDDEESRDLHIHDGQLEGSRLESFRQALSPWQKESA
jgi:tRNA threonylcarbamoyladenosine biosynthesis protein TsaE